jgi:Protein of unknown function (DUF1266)
MDGSIFVLTAIYDGSGWLMHGRYRAYQVRQRYYNVAAVWQAGALAHSRKEAKIWLHQHYRIDNASDLRRCLEQLHVQALTSQALFSAVLASFAHGYGTLDNQWQDSDTAQRQFTDYLSTIQEITHHQLAKDLDKTQSLHSPDLASKPGQQQRIKLLRWQRFLRRYQLLWHDAPLQKNHRGLYVGKLAYHLVQSTQLLRHAYQTGLMDVLWLEQELEKIKFIFHKYFDNWQLFWSSYTLGLLYSVESDKNLTLKETLSLLKTILFDRIYAFISTDSSPFFLEDIFKWHNFMLLKKAISYYAGINGEKLIDGHWHTDEYGQWQYEELMLDLIKRKIEQYHRVLALAAQQAKLENLLYWHIYKDSNISLYSCATSKSYAQPSFWYLVKQYEVMQHAGEIPIWQGYGQTLFTNFGIYYQSDNYTSSKYFQSWHSDLVFQSSMRKDGTICILLHKQLIFTVNKIPHASLATSPTDAAKEFLHLIDTFNQTLAGLLIGKHHFSLKRKLHISG